MKKLAILALAVMIALPASAAGVTISGYIDIGYIAAQNGSNGVAQQASGATNGTWNGNDGFSLNEVNIDLSSQLTNDINAFVSLDVNTPTAAVVVDYAYIDFANPGPFDLNVRAGRIPSVIGIEQRASESNQTKFINLSLLSPLTVGSVDGAAVYGSFSPVNYAIAISNYDLAGFDTMPMNAPVPPSNNNGAAAAVANESNNDLAISGRIGVIPIEGLEVGVSAARDVHQTTPAVLVPKNPSRVLLGVDVSYSWGALTLKGEYVSAKEEQTAAVGATKPSDVKVSAYYVKGLYDLTSKLTLGVRYNVVKVTQNSINNALASDKLADYNTLSFAGCYKVADNVLLKAEYDINDESIIGYESQAGKENDNDVIALSLVGSF